VIRTVALGVVCLAGLGAIAAAAKRLTPPQRPDVIFPVVADNKTDRLPLMARGDAQTEREKVNVMYIPPVEDSITSSQSASQEVAASPPARRVSRHGHNPHGRKSFDAARQRPTKDFVDRAPKRVADAKECRSDGLDPLLRKLNLSPKCE